MLYKMTKLQHFGLLSIFLMACSKRNAFSFQMSHRISRFQISASGTTPTLAEKHVSSDETETYDDVKNTKSSKAELKFGAEINTKSNPLSYDSKEEVISFFKNPQNRNLFITAGGKRDYQTMSMTSDILRDWTKQCEHMGTALPDENDEVFTVKTGGVQFPGLKLETSAIMGIKLIEKDGGLKYQITLIGDDRKVKGLPPVVSVFNKLTGGGSESGSSSNLSTTNIICDFGEEESKVAFKAETFLTVHIKFPAILLKILPTSKEKAEEQGSQSIYNSLSKDVQASMEAFEETYLELFS